MAIINYDFYCGEDKYSDGDIEEYLRYLAENHIDITTLDEREKTYPVFYHLSHLRENIINWYPIEKHQNVLEIGAGCGAITGALCRKAGSVVSVELSKRRAEINYLRHFDAENLTIYVGNQNDIRFDRKFDYVVLNGVFEYAMSFTEGSDPYGVFLEKCRSFLKPDGKLLIAIENRLGLKYFTGSAEDHTGNYFLGLNKYLDNDTVRTFSKSEWIKLLNRYGLKCKFYYPYPDYKFPVEIFTDKSLPVNGYGKPYYNLEANRYLWLRENELAKTFAEEGIAGSFANSFFLEISESQCFANVDYCKISCDRKDESRIITSILQDDNGHYVEKRAACPAAIPHIESIYRNSLEKQGNDISYLPGKLKKNAVIFDYVKETTLKNRLLQLLEQQDIEGFQAELKRFFRTYFAPLKSDAFTANEEFRAVFGPTEISDAQEAVYGGNIDLIFDNVYCPENRYLIIDPEWVFDFAIPKSFIMWRAVSDFYSHYPEMQKRICHKKLMEALGIQSDHVEVFCRWNEYFVYQWLRANSIETYVKPIHITSMDYMVSLLRAKTMLSCGLYYDCGTGYSEGQKLIEEVPLTDNCFTVAFDLSKFENLKALRFDPVEGMAIRCRVSSEQAHLIPMNAWAKEDGFDVFLTEDPMYDVILDKLPSNGHLYLSGCVVPIDYKTKAELCTQECIQHKEQELQLYKAKAEVSSRDYEQLMAAQIQLQNTLQNTLNQNTALRDEMQLLYAQCGQKEAAIAHQQEQLQMKQEEILRQQTHIGTLENTILELRKTRWQRFTAFLKNKWLR